MFDADQVLSKFVAVGQVAGKQNFNIVCWLLVASFRRRKKKEELRQDCLFQRKGMKGNLKGQ